MTNPNICKNICRSCLEPTIKTYPLTGQLVNVEVDVVSMLEFCTSSKMDLSDDLPKSVCVACFRTIRIAYRFLKQFYEAQTKLIASRNKNIQPNSPEHGETNYDQDFLSIDSYAEQGTSEVLKINENDNEIQDNDENHVIEGVDSDEIHINEEVDGENRENEVDDYEHEDSYDNLMDEAVDEETDIDFENEEVIFDAYSEIDCDNTEIKVEYINLSEDNEIVTVKEENSDLVNLFNLADINNGQSKIEVIMDDIKDEDTNDKLFRYICPICDNRFCRAETFFAHVSKYNLSVITCPRCHTQPELEINEYYRHYMDFHKYHCDICDKVMSSSYGYHYHMKHHENVRNFKCPINGCQRSFLMKHLLRKHIKSHSMKNGYACHLCDATFNTNDSLRYHLKIHVGQKDHLCTMCGRAFYQAVHLRDHMYRHMGYKKFVCDICGKGFITNGSLKKHIMYCSRKHNIVTVEK